MDTQVLIENNEAAFKALFTHATVGILIVNSSGKIVHANPFVCQMLNYNVQEFVGKDVSALLPTDLQERHREHIHTYFRKPLSRPMGQGMELVAMKHNGEKIYVEISLCSYTLESERLAVAFVTDISRQKAEAERLQTYRQHLETLVKERTQELNDALDREKELGQVKSRFVSLASHEFRTPLSTILSSSALISRYNESSGSENIEKHVTRIRNAIHNLTNILNDFLSIDKLEQGAVVVKNEEFNLGVFIDEVCEELEDYLKAGQIIEKSHSGSLVVLTDQKLIKNILLNLISNASKYSAEGKTISIRTEVTESSLLVKVTDQGIGIPKEEQEKLFTLFYRGSNVGTMHGTGLGLNIVAKYISLLAGEINVESQPEAGSTFTLNIPMPRK